MKNYLSKVVNCNIVTYSYRVPSYKKNGSLKIQLIPNPSVTTTLASLWGLRVSVAWIDNNIEPLVNR